MQNSYFFYAGLVLLSVHELDAVRCHEWRILPVLRSLDDQTGYTLFTLLHVPIYYWIFRQLTFGNDSAAFRLGFDAFCIIHVGLHYLLRHHRHYEFTDWLSKFLIVGAGLCGLIDLYVVLS